MFGITSSIKYGWEKSREHLELVLFATLLVLAVSSIIGETGSDGRLDTPLLGIVGTIFLIIIRIGYTKILLRIDEGEKPKFVDIFKEYPTFWRYLAVSILVPLTLLGGLILLIIPGIFWGIRFAFSPIIVIDTKSGPIASMKESWAITKGNFWHLLLFWIVVALVNLLGLLVFGIGLIVTIPVTTFASIYVYRILSKAKASVATVPAP